jgi:predicted ATP-dependent serine protease
MDAVSAPRERAVLASSLELADHPRARTGEHALDDLLEGGFALGGCVLVHGRRASGKTRLTYRWGTRLPCLVVCAELSLEVAQTTIHTTAGHLGNAYLLRDLAGWEHEATRLGVRAVVLDSLGATARPLATLRRAREWAEEHGAIVYAIAQCNKRGNARGTEELAHWADYEVRVRRSQSHGKAVVEIIKSRLSPAGEVELSLGGYSR